MSAHHPLPNALPRIYVFGASGCGSTTLGEALGRRLGLLHLEADDFYWQPTAQPFTQKVAPAERVQTMQAYMAGHAGWVLSGGSLDEWGQALLPDLTLAVFLHLPQAERMQRLQLREQARDGERLLTDPVRAAVFERLLQWAQTYDSASDGRRSLHRHQQWMAGLHCPVLALDSRQSTVQLLAAVIGELQGQQGPSATPIRPDQDR